MLFPHEIKGSGVSGKGGSYTQENIFQDYLNVKSIFKKDRDVLRPSYVPETLLHRDSQIDQIASILATALKGHRPSDILIFGKTGTGKTATAKYLGKEIKKAASTLPDPLRDVRYIYINCEIVDTQYGVLQNIGNRFIDDFDERIPPTGWSTERVYDTLYKWIQREYLFDFSIDLIENSIDKLNDGIVDSTVAEIMSKKLAEMGRDTSTKELETSSVYRTDESGWQIQFSEFLYEIISFKKDIKVYTKSRRVVVVVLDEIDRFVYKSGDDTLYRLTKINDDLKHAQISIIGISNDLKFTELLDPRIQSRLSDEKIVFPPYDADQLKDILRQRADIAFKAGVIDESVISLCAAVEAHEHGDARRALDLLRVSAELAERQKEEVITEQHVIKAKNKIELDCVIEAVRTLPIQSKFVLLGILLGEEGGNPKQTTGDVYMAYKELARKAGTSLLTQRRVADLISELDMMGLVSARVRSFGRGGRTREIQAGVPILETKRLLQKDPMLEPIKGYKLRNQSTLM